MTVDDRNGINKIVININIMLILLVLNHDSLEVTVKKENKG